MDKPGLNANLYELAKSTITVQPDTSLEEILPTTLGQPYPVPVVGEDGEFHGVVSRKSMISILSDNNDSADKS